MVVTGGASTSRGQKKQKPNKKGKGNGAQKKKGPACFLCGGQHIIKNCPEWQAVRDATEAKKKQGNA